MVGDSKGGPGEDRGVEWEMCIFIWNGQRWSWSFAWILAFGFMLMGKDLKLGKECIIESVVVKCWAVRWLLIHFSIILSGVSIFFGR